MLRLCSPSRRKFHYTFPLRSFSSSNPKIPIELQSPKNSQQQTSLSPSPSPSSLCQPPNGDSSFTPTSLLALSASALLAAVLASTSLKADTYRNPYPLYDVVDNTMQKSNESLSRIYRHLKRTGVAASVLWQSLRSVLSSANHEVWAGFELRVAALLADIAAANASRRAAIVNAGGGKVVDWLLETVATGGDSCGTQAESARALSYLIEDPNVCEAILGRPHAVPNLLRFIFSCHPQRKKEHSRRSSFDVSDSLKGRSMLVAAIMDIVTSNCDGLDKIAYKPSLSRNAEMRDIAAAIQVIEEGGLHLDDFNGNGGEDNGDKGVKGIGIKIFEGTTVLGLARTNRPVEIKLADVSHPRHNNSISSDRLLENKYADSLPQANISSTVVPGLWDDLHYEHVAVPFAAWALANWAMASEENRSHIQELDRDGHAIMAALLAPERSVKWHGSLVARFLLEDHNLPINDSVPDWTSSLLSTLFQASKNEDIPLAQVALSAFLVSVERSRAAQKIVMDKGLKLLRDTAKQTKKHKQVQEVLSKAMELISTGDIRLSLEESQKWSGVLLQWVFGSYSSDTVRTSARKILSCILEDYGPFSLPVSQGWLAILLSEILSSGKTSSTKGNGHPKIDKVKTQIDQSNVLSAGQNTNQLAVAVVSLAGNQLGSITESMGTFPLDDLLSLEPFAGALKNLKKESLQKINAADSAVATLRGIKSLTELCVEDHHSQKKIVDYGVLCLLKRFLLCDDYEKLAAMEVYDALRSPEAQDKVPGSSESSTVDNADPSGIRLPPTAHIRKHAARLLNILSLLPEVQKAIVDDEIWYKWLDDCANGKIPGCNDLKMQSYARATLLNVLCNDQIYQDTSSANAKGKRRCPRYPDMIFLINPEAPHWKCPDVTDQDTEGKDGSTSARTNSLDPLANRFLGNDPMVDPGSSKDRQSPSVDVSHGGSEIGNPPLDVVFVHGLRGGPYKTWRISEDKSSTKSGFVEKIDEEAGKQGTFWPGEWLPSDFPQARLFTLKYKTNLTQWSGATLPLQEVSSMLLQKLVDAGIGNRPVVFVTHSMGGLVVKQLLYRAKLENVDNLVNNTVGIVFYSCPHFGSKLADMPWRMGLVLRPAPTIGELRSGSPRLVELNDFIRHLHKKGPLEVLSFCETKVTPIVEGYGGWAFRMEIVPLESAYPGFGELVVLESTDHINSCKPISRTDPSYTETLEFLRKLRAQLS